MWLYITFKFSHFIHDGLIFLNEPFHHFQENYKCNDSKNVICCKKQHANYYFITFLYITLGKKYFAKYYLYYMCYFCNNNS